jgi:Zn-dependent peptidase ImmA (M78 family)
MFEMYKQTELETKIERLYKEKNILTPIDLEIENVASAFGIEIDYSLNEGPQCAIWGEQTAVIFLHQNTNEVKKREVFFHEFGHPILHCGNQTIMKNKSFKDLQEAQANQFRMYAAMPFFMIKELKLHKYESQIISHLQKIFKVSHKLAKCRFEQIKRRILQAQIDEGSFLIDVEDEDLQENFFSNLSVNDLFTPSEIQAYKLVKLQTKKKNKLYYDALDGKFIPIRYVIEVEREEVNWSEKFKFFPIDEDFDVFPINEIQELDTDVPISYDSLTLNPLKPNDFAVDLKSLKRMLMFFDVDPYNIKRFVIDAQALESVLQLSIFNDIVEKKLNESLPISNCQ